MLKKFPDILKNTRQIFVHKIKDFLLDKSDQLFIFVFVSLKMVAYYGNYMMVIAKLSLLFSSVLDSIMAGIGNLIAEGNKSNIMKVFWELMTIRHFVAGLMCFCIYHFIEPFITIWLGAEYILGRDILILLCINRYIGASRGVVDMYNHAYGHYADVWAAWTELIINVGVTLIAGYYWGIAGILLGKIASTAIIVILWKPYYLFTSGLQESYLSYWLGASRNFVVSVVSIAIAHVLLPFIPFNAAEGYLSWVLFSLVGLSIYLMINLTLIYFFCKGVKESIHRLRSIVIKH